MISDVSNFPVKRVGLKSGWLTLREIAKLENVDPDDEVIMAALTADCPTRKHQKLALANAG